MKGRAYHSSPVGTLLIESSGESIVTVNFLKDSKQPETMTAAIEKCIAQLDEYFFTGRKFFTLDLAPEGTAFQKQIWNELLAIPFGKTISYEALAIRIGNIKSIRAVGLANGQNPIAIIIPCHRVIGKGGELVGYGGGLEYKEWLLHHEGAIRRQLNLF